MTPSNPEQSIFSTPPPKVQPSRNSRPYDRGLLTIWFLKILPGLTLEPNSSPLKTWWYGFRDRDDPSAFCWPSAYSQARKVSLVWDSLREWFFLVKVLDAQCLGISSKIESAFRFRLGFGYTTRLVHGCEPWPNMKSAALAANSPAACQRNFASLIGEGGKTILPKHIRCMASWRNVFIDSFDLFDEKEKNMEKSCWRVDLEPTGLAFDKKEISISWISGKIDTTTA